MDDVWKIGTINRPFAPFGHGDGTFFYCTFEFQYSCSEKKYRNIQSPELVQQQHRVPHCNNISIQITKCQQTTSDGMERKICLTNDISPIIANKDVTVSISSGKSFSNQLSHFTNFRDVAMASLFQTTPPTPSLSSIHIIPQYYVVVVLRILINRY